MRDRWITKDTTINQVEASAGVVSLSTWKAVLAECDAIHFIDSNISFGSLANGWSRVSDTCHLVGRYWKVAATLRIFIWIDRVESKTNIADGPAKYRYDNVEFIKARQVTPAVSELF